MMAQERYYPQNADSRGHGLKTWSVYYETRVDIMDEEAFDF